MRFLKALAWFVGGIVLLLVTAYVVRGVAGQADVDRAKERAVRELTDAVDAAGPWTPPARIAGRAPTYSWREVTCQLGTNDGGWIVNDYTQECTLRAVALVPTASAGPGCRSVAPGRPSLPAGWAATRGPTSALTATDRDYTCPDGLVGPPQYGVTRVLDGRRPGDLSASPGWIVAEKISPLSDSVLGCSPWSVVFCDSPVDEPVLSTD
jgi:hypothetical protein